MLKTLTPPEPDEYATQKERRRVDAFDRERTARGDILETVVRAMATTWPDYDVPVFAECLRELAESIAPKPADKRFFRGKPVFRVKPEGETYWTTGDAGEKKRGCFLMFTCPRCGKKNQHGGYHAEPGAGDGDRSSHCRCWRSYGIVEQGGPNDQETRQ